MTRKEIEAFITSNNITMACEFVPWSKSRNANEKHRSLNWRVTIFRNGKPVIATDYMAGAAHAPSYKPRRTLCEDEAFVHETETGTTARRLTTVGACLKGKPILPDIADVLYSLAMDAEAIDYTFDDWAQNFGYDTDSRKAEAIYRQCLEHAIKMRSAGINLEELQAACVDY